MFVTGQANGPESKIYGLPLKESKIVLNHLRPFGGRVGQDGQMFQNHVKHVVDVLQFTLNYQIVSCTLFGEHRALLWTLHRPLQF